MAISYQQAVEALSTGDWTVEAIFELVRQVSASVPGATKDTIYLLNSGLMPDGFGSSDVARALVESGRAVSVAKRTLRGCSVGAQSS